MKKYKKKYLYAGILILPLIMSAVIFKDMHYLIKEEFMSDNEIIVNTVSYYGDMIWHMLIFAPALILASDYVQRYGEGYCIVRMKSRDEYSMRAIRANLKLSCELAVVIAIMTFMQMALLADADILLNMPVVVCTVLSCVFQSIFYYRALSIYRILKELTGRRIISLTLIMALFIFEWATYSYVIVREYLYPCYTFSIPSKILTGQESMNTALCMIGIYICVNILITLILIAVTRKTDMLEEQK